MPSQTSLLSLPAEVREQILMLAMQRSWPPPRTMWDHRDADAPRWTPLNLLAVNGQLRAETLAAIDHMQKTGSISADAFVLVNGHEWIVQWTHLNLGLRPGAQLDLTVQLCVLSTEALQMAMQRWELIALEFRECLCRMLSEGPRYYDELVSGQSIRYRFDRDAHTRLAQRARLSIGRLSVKVAFRDPYTPSTWAEAVHCIFRMLKALAREPWAKQVLDSVHVQAAYVCQGEHVHREREWVVGQTSMAA